MVEQTLKDVIYPKTNGIPLFIEWEGLRGTGYLSYAQPMRIFVLGKIGCLPIDEKIITSQGTMTIKQLAEQGFAYVLSDNEGKIEYNKSYPIYKGQQLLYKIITTYGTIRATSEHPFFTEKGWKKVSELAVSDKIYLLDLPNIKESVIIGKDHPNNSKLQSMQKGIEEINYRNSKGLVLLAGVLPQIKSYNRRTQSMYQERVRKVLLRCKAPKEKVYSQLPELQRTIRSIYMLLQQKILHKTLLYNMEKLPQQPSKKGILQNKAQQANERSVEKNVGRKETENIKGIPREQKDIQTTWYRMGKENVEQWRTQQATEDILSTAPRKTIEQHTAQKPHDKHRENNRINIKGYWNKCNMEQTHTNRKTMEIPRFPSTEYQHSNRMQRTILAYREGYRREKKFIREEWLSSNYAARENNTVGKNSNYKRAIVMQIVPDTFEPTFDLFVERAHNFFLEKGFLTHNSGKSSLLETFGVNYLRRGTCVVDLYGSSDGESLAWLRASFAKYIKILLLTGEGITLKLKPPNVDLKYFADFKLSDTNEYNLIINNTFLYNNHEECIDAINVLLDVCYKRRGWSKIICMIVREAANILYARLKVNAGDSATAKSEAVRIIRESRHHGIAMIMDALKWTSVDIDIRNLSDFIFIKRIGIFQMPADLHWLFSYYEAELFRSLKANQFIVVDTDGPTGFGAFPYHSWHKEPKEDIIKNIGLDSLNYTKVVTQQKVSHSIHRKIIEMFEISGMKMPEIAILLTAETKQNISLNDVKRELLLHQYEKCSCKT